MRAQQDAESEAASDESDRPGERASGPGAVDLASAATAPQGHPVRIVRALRRMLRAYEVHSHRLAAEYDITGPQLLCRSLIRERGPITATAIARQVHLSPSTVVGILDRLEQKDLVRRERDEQDRRLVNVTLTERGERLAASGPLPLQDELSAALGQLSQSRQAALAESLEYVVELMEAG